MATSTARRFLNARALVSTSSVSPRVMTSTFIKRVNTNGGQDISKAFSEGDLGNKITLPYQADYIFWKPV